MTNTPEQPKPWGLLATIGFSIIVFIAFLTIQSFALGIYAYFKLQDNPGSNFLLELTSIAGDGFGIAISLIPSAAIASLLVILFSYIRNGITVRDYLGLHYPGIKSILFWVLMLVLFAGAMEGINYFLDRPIPDWMLDSYQSAGVLPLFWIALIVAAPVFEELLFRGFLFEGIRYSWLGNVGAVVITSALWAVIHIQYEIYEVVIIFLIGLLFGLAKIKTGSVFTTIILHALMNLAATAQIAIMID